MAFDFSSVEDDEKVAFLEEIIQDVRIQIIEQEQTEKYSALEFLTEEEWREYYLAFCEVALAKCEYFKEKTVYEFAEKHDKFTSECALPLLKLVSSSQYHLKKGFLDSRLDSRISESSLDEIFPQMKGCKPIQSDEYKYYPLEEGVVILIIPLRDWLNPNVITVDENASDKRIYLFVDEKGTMTTIGGQRFPNPETLVFRGIFTTTSRKRLELENLRLELHNS